MVGGIGGNIQYSGGYSNDFGLKTTRHRIYGSTYKVFLLCAACSESLNYLSRKTTVCNLGMDNGSLVSQDASSYECLVARSWNKTFHSPSMDTHAFSRPNEFLCEFSDVKL